MSERKIEWGAPIRVDGKRPEWLRETQVALFENKRDEWLGWDGELTVSKYFWGEPDGKFEGCPIHIRLPADHPHYHKSGKPLCVDIPDWAIKEVIDAHLREADWAGGKVWRVGEIKDDAKFGVPYALTVMTLARYIATHEEPPVDPDLIVARQIEHNICAAQGLERDAELAISGDLDEKEGVKGVLRAIKRARELAEQDRLKDSRDD